MASSGRSRPAPDCAALELPGGAGAGAAAQAAVAMMPMAKTSDISTRIELPPSRSGPFPGLGHKTPSLAGKFRGNVVTAYDRQLLGTGSQCRIDKPTDERALFGVACREDWMERGTATVKTGHAEMLKGGVIMDVVTADQ